MSYDFDIEEVLRKPLFAHLATGSSDGPRESPVWFLWEGGELWVVGNDRDSFPKRLRMEPRCAIGIVEFDLANGRLRHVGIRGVGTVEALDPARLHRLLVRYLGENEATWNQHFRLVRIVPTSVVARDQSYFGRSAPPFVALIGESIVKRVTGIGGIFFKAKDAETLREWYRQHLGISVEEWGGTAFRWATPDNPNGTGTTVWSVFEDSSPYFAPSRAEFMINYRVEDLHSVLAALRAEGCVVDDTVEESDFGKFGWVMDPEGNRVELWQPPEGQ